MQKLKTMLEFNYDKFASDCTELSAKMGMLYITISNYVKQENEKKNNGEEYDEKGAEGYTALMHLSHAMGELVEAKDKFVELTIPDILCKMQYESEMNEALQQYGQMKKFNDILNEDE